MMYMKRSFMMMSVVVLVTLAIAACGGNGNSSSGSGGGWLRRWQRGSDSHGHQPGANSYGQQRLNFELQRFD